MGYFLLQGKKTLLTDPYKSIPPDACIVIETIDFRSFLNSLTTGKGLFGELGKIREFESNNQKLKLFTDQLNKVGLKKVFNESTAIISFHPTIKGKLHLLLSMAIPGEISSGEIKDILHSSGIKDVIESKISGNSVLKIPYSIKNLKDTIYISLISGLMVCSGSADLIDKARSQIISGSDVRSHPGFSRVLLASGKFKDKVFVVFANMPELLKSVLGIEKQGIAKQIARLAGTAEGDIYINDEGIVLSGYTESVDSTEFLYRYKFLSPKTFHTYKILPSSTVLFETTILPVINTDNKSDSTISRETVALAVKLKEYTGTEITKAYIDIKDKPISDNTLIIYRILHTCPIPV